MRESATFSRTEFFILAAVSGWLGWTNTIGYPLGFRVLANYSALGIAAAGTTWLLAHWLRTSRTRTILACTAAIALAWSWWGRFDSYKEHHYNIEQHISTTTIHYRFGGQGYQHISFIGEGSWSQEGPIDQYGQRHGKWRFSDSHWNPFWYKVTDHWFYLGEEVSAVEWRAMSAD
jgi:hypothetical protein